jgi:hypothetical protein
MSLFNYLLDTSCTVNINEVINKWDSQFISMIIQHFNNNYMQFSVIIGVPLEQIKTETPTNALYAIAMMTSVKLFMHGHMTRIESMSYSETHSQRIQRIRRIYFASK